jgi:solute carrier family 36 (proton-coupled amino acid transporter)
VPNDIIWRRIQHRFPKEKHNIAQICIRSGVILIMGAVAAAVPDLEPFIALVGAVFFSTLGKLDFRHDIRVFFYF